MTTIKVKDKLLSKNDQHGLANREVFDRHRIWCINLISAPGSGKTTLIECTVDHFAHQFNIGVLVGDLDTEYDSRRIAAHGVPVHQIITGGACHLNARTIGEFISHFDLDKLEVLIIENVGKNALKIKSDIAIMALSAKTGEGLKAWFDWFESHAKKHNTQDESRVNE